MELILNNKWTWIARENNGEWCLYESKPYYDHESKSWNTDNDYFYLDDIVIVPTDKILKVEESLMQIVNNKLISSDSQQETLRDKFAMAALETAQTVLFRTGEVYTNNLAKLTYEIADEMLKVREEK